MFYGLILNPYSSPLEEEKTLRRIGKYWKRDWSQYKNRSDEAPDTDSQDPEDHCM